MVGKKTLVIVDHPTYDRSNANRRLVEEMRKYPDDIVIHNLQSAYPTGTIDIAKEHCLVDNTGSIIFQFPLYWFTCPPKTKEWFDKVLTAGWAFAGAYHLEGKKVGIAVTCGSEEKDYTSEGVHHRSVEEYLCSIQKSLEMCKADYAGMFAIYGIKNDDKETAQRIAQGAKEYIEFINSVRA